MIIKLFGKTFLKEVQNEFHKCYPHLWIDFFYESKPSILPRSPSQKINPETLLTTLPVIKEETCINIDNKLTVAQVEKDFFDNLGVRAKVMRISGNILVGTPYTNDWTLEDQNFSGSQITL